MLVQGVGHVGARLARLLVDEGAEVVVSDVRAERADALVRELGVASVPYEHALSTACDILSPNALGGVFHDGTIPQLACRAIVGAANNQLGTPDADRALAERGILFAPDFVVGGGGIINIAEEFTGYDRTRAQARTGRIEATTMRVLEHAARDRCHAAPRGRSPRAPSRRGGRRRPSLATR